MLRRNSNYRHRFFRLIPPIIDSLLLITGFVLMFSLQQYPTTQPWMAVKLTALLLYIGLGVIALNRVNNYKIQVLSFIAAVLTVLFMVSVAMTHNPYGIFLFLID